MNPFSNFNPRALEFDHSNAWACAHAAEMVYPGMSIGSDDSEPQKETNAQWASRMDTYLRDCGFTETAFFDQMGTQAFLAGRKEYLLLSFRGTEVDSLEDIKADLRIRKVGAPLGGRCHRGFLTALTAVWDDFKLPGQPKAKGIEHTIKDMKATFNGSRPPIFITGHSLGAALATLATAFMLEEGRPVQGLYTFGSPRVGDHQFVMSLNSRMGQRNYRLVNNNDVVTRLPPRAAGYDHAGEFWYLSEKGNLTKDPNSWYLFLDRRLGEFCDIGEAGLDAIKDHSMNDGKDGYIPALDKALTLPSS